MTESPICPWCKLPMDDPDDRTLDHIIPRSRGGPGKAWNHQYLHRRCNSSKGSRLTPEAIELAAKHGIVLCEPLPTSWPGSNRIGGSLTPNPGPRPAPSPQHKVTVRKLYEVECHTCGAVIGAERSYEEALTMRRNHIAENSATHEHEAA